LFDISWSQTMTANSMKSIGTLVLNEGAMLPDPDSGAASFEHVTPDGITVRARVENGRTVGYVAHDKDGVALSVVRVRLGNESDPKARDTCWLCFCRQGGICTCFPERCPNR